MIPPAPTRIPSRAVFVALARAANAVFFVVTATYCVLTYSSFAYQQFIRPHLVSSLASFVVWHHLWHWVLLGLTALTLLPELKCARGRMLAWGYLAAMTAVGVLVLVRPVLPAVENNAAGLVLAFAFLLPPLWLAVFDHWATSDGFDPVPVERRRVLAAAAAAAVAVWASHVAVVPLRFKDLGDLTLSGPGLIFSTIASLAVHGAVFFTVALLLLAGLGAARLVGGRGRGEYWAIVAAAAVGCWVIVARLVFASLSFRGPAAWLLALELAMVAAAVWSGIARRLAVSRAGEVSALEAWFFPLTGAATPRQAAVGLAVLPLLAFALTERVATFDWDFLVQNLCVVAVWIVAGALAHAIVRVRMGEVPSRPILAAAGMILLLAGVRGNLESGLSASLARATFVPEFALDGYAAVDPSYRLVRRLLWVDPPGSAEFYDVLRANSLIDHAPIAPIDVDFVSPLRKAPTRPPHIFLFVIDSLRRDYVSVYNPAVTFTPSFARFAAEGYAFDRAFTRYGGTGLSMPAIWAGGLLAHKEYVLPFQRMNALGKLLAVNGYRSIISMDHITDQLLGPERSVVELDRGRDEMQYDFCTTLAELETRLSPSVTDSGPVFAHTRSLNLHVSKLTNRSVALAHAYDGFQGPAAAAVGRMDRCFGRFIDFLKARRIYDDSIVILTSDHGDSLGEARRWGHSYTLFPEIVRTPLLVHIPPGLGQRFTADVDAASLSTDLTPTLYALLGYTPASLGPLYGAPLFVPPGADTQWRRRNAFLVASSYGPVYGVLRDNGRSLYIADGVNLRDYAYDISGLRPIRVGVTDESRSTGRAIIREHVEALAKAYHIESGH